MGRKKKKNQGYRKPKGWQQRECRISSVGMEEAIGCYLKTPSRTSIDNLLFDAHSHKLLGSKKFLAIVGDHLSKEIHKRYFKESLELLKSTVNLSGKPKLANSPKNKHKKKKGMKKLIKYPFGPKSSVYLDELWKNEVTRRKIGKEILSLLGNTTIRSAAFRLGISPKQLYKVLYPHTSNIGSNFRLDEKTINKAFKSLFKYYVEKNPLYLRRLHKDKKRVLHENNGLKSSPNRLAKIIYTPVNGQPVWKRK